MPIYMDSTPAKSTLFQQPVQANPASDPMSSSRVFRRKSAEHIGNKKSRWARLASAGLDSQNDYPI